MKKKKASLKIDWKSKFIDLLIVIVGISIAFKLNNWNESIKSEARTKDYIQAFHDETLANQENLTAAVNYAEANKSNIDTLKNILLLKNYDDERIMGYAAGMMGLAQFKPITITMDNITASGEFDLIKDVELRKQLISTYESYNTINQSNIFYTQFSGDNHFDKISRRTYDYHRCIHPKTIAYETILEC